MASPLKSQLDQVLVRQLRSLEREVGAISEAEIAAVMPEARAIHQRALRTEEHMSPDLNEWAVMGIAMNIIARGRGYDTSRIPTMPLAGKPIAPDDLDLHPRPTLME